MAQKQDAFLAQMQSEQLHEASAAGNLAEVERLLSLKYPTNRFDFLGKTPLHYAAENGHLAIVDRLLRAGANVNAHDEQHIGNSPLREVALKCSFEMAKKLIDAGANPALPGWMNRSAMDVVNTRKDVEARKVQKLFHEAIKRYKLR